jgi:XTP/dITP diphosphohydrolase
MTVYCATSNPGKLREFRISAEGSGILVEPVPGLPGFPACEENGATFEENAVLKALHYAVLAPGLFFADDSGLEVDALGGAPGIYSARFAGPGATDQANNDFLLDKMRGVRNRSARFVCAIALAEGARVIGTFRGAVEGEILEEPHGLNGFGYDPLFFYRPFGRSFGEISAERKLTVSHRGLALQALWRHVTGAPAVTVS